MGIFLFVLRQACLKAETNKKPLDCKAGIQIHLDYGAQ
jgi:hypothetical protein